MKTEFHCFELVDADGNPLLVGLAVEGAQAPSTEGWDLIADNHTGAGLRLRRYVRHGATLKVWHK